MKKQNKAAAAEERRIFLELERLKRESKMCGRNNEKLRRSWMKIMTKLKIPLMEDDAEIIRNTLD